MKEVRMVSIEWIEKEVGSFDRLTKIAAKKKLSVQTIIKEILNSYTESNDA
jgi:predicted DNA-binding ribbon-helix-helix protein